MRYSLPTTSSSSNNDDSDSSFSDDINRSGTGSCFNIEDKQEQVDADTDPMDIDRNIDDVGGGEEADLGCIAEEDNAYPPEYYLDQENNSDGSEDEEVDDSDSSSLFLDILETQFQRYEPCSLCLLSSPIRSVISLS
jgi:hypothetical protein